MGLPKCSHKTHLSSYALLSLFFIVQVILPNQFPPFRDSGATESYVDAEIAGYTGLAQISFDLQKKITCF